MRIRHIEVKDVPELDRLRAQVEKRLGFKLDLPEIAVEWKGHQIINPKFASALLFEDDNDMPRMATFLKRTTEAVLLMDREDGVGQREWWSRFRCIERAQHMEAVASGIEETFAFVPPQLVWGRALEKIGWESEPFPVWRKRHG